MSTEPTTKKFTFIDLFAGAGGFSEGFLQAELPDGTHYEFVFASDINPNCELTHRVRYNDQLGLGIEFLCKSIRDEDFIAEMLHKLPKDAKGRRRDIDVVCGGPPCQSFSLAGKRRLNDKKDDLFAHYLDVISVLQPKYFVMENVKGILTKDNGKHRERILREIRSIVDVDAVEGIAQALESASVDAPDSEQAQRLRWIACAMRDWRADQALLRMRREKIDRRPKEDSRDADLSDCVATFKTATATLAYKESKTDRDVLTVRHALNLLARPKALTIAREEVRAFLEAMGSGAQFEKFLNATTQQAILATAIAATEPLCKRERSFEDLLNAMRDLANKLAPMPAAPMEPLTAITPALVAEVRQSNVALPLALEYLCRFAEFKASARSIRHRITELKSLADIDEDAFVSIFDDCVSALDLSEVAAAVFVDDGSARLLRDLLDAPMSKLLELATAQTRELPAANQVEKLVRQARLYEVATEATNNKVAPWVLNAADYGVPQNRQRVAFVGVRKDQRDVYKPARTVDEPVTILEALWDLDFLERGAPPPGDYQPDIAQTRLRQFFSDQNKTPQEVQRPRKIDGRLDGGGKSFAQWSKEGRLRSACSRGMTPIYKADEKAPSKEARLHNHDASKHDDKVTARMQLMINAGGWSEALRDQLAASTELRTDKRDYTVLNWKGQAPTVMTIADDFVHYRQPRAPTVREMARLQSFDDDFVFQGKRTTGGDRRKDEVPQFTLVGNAVPPLMARAIAMELLRGLVGVERKES